MPYRLDNIQGDWPAEELRKGVEGLLAESMVLTLATAGPEHGPHANLAFYAFDDDLVLYFVSERSTRHSLHLSEQARAAATVFLPPPVFGEQLRGVQLAGRAGEAWGHQAEAALAAYQGGTRASRRIRRCGRSSWPGAGRRRSTGSRWRS